MCNSEYWLLNDSSSCLWEADRKGMDVISDVRQASEQLNQITGNWVCKWQPSRALTTCSLPPSLSHTHTHSYVLCNRDTFPVICVVNGTIAAMWWFYWILLWICFVWEEYFQFPASFLLKQLCFLKQKFCNAIYWGATLQKSTKRQRIKKEVKKIN